MVYIDEDEMTRALDIIREQSEPKAFDFYMKRTMCPDCPLARKAIDGEP